MKSIIIAGQKTKAYCPDCGKFGMATYAYGCFPFDSGIIAENVMRATCDRCGIIVALAHQSASVLKEALQEPKTATTIRLPQERGHHQCDFHRQTASSAHQAFGGKRDFQCQ